MEPIGRHRTPGWGGRLDAETEEAQEGLEEDGLRNAEGGLDDDRSQGVRQDVAGPGIVLAGARNPGPPAQLARPTGESLGPPPSRPIPPTRPRAGGSGLVHSPHQPA